MADVAEIIRNLNANSGQVPDAPQVAEPVATQPVQTQAPAANPTPIAQTPATLQAPALEKTVINNNDDPEWARRNTPAAQQPAAEPVVQTPVATPEPAATPTAVDDTVLFNRVSEMTRGVIKSEKDLTGLYQRYTQLEDQVKAGLKPKFLNERAEWAHKVLSENPGQELDVAIRIATALKVAEKLPSMSAKDKLFNGFMLDPLNSDLSPDEMRGVFDAQYEKKYGNPEERDILTKREHDIAVRQAEQAIQKISSEFKITQAEPERISQEVVSSVEQVINEFGGVRIGFSDNPTENEFLTIPVGNDQELAQIKEDVLDPGKWHQNYLSQFETDNGFDYQGYIQDRWERENHVAIREQAFEHGKKLGRLEALNEARNASTPADLADKGNRAPIAAPVQKSFKETFREAALGR